MKTLKLIHAADLHLDSAFEALGPAKAALRRAEQRQMLLKVFSLVDECGADLLLLAGDVFDYSGHAYAETVETLRSCIENCPVPILVSPGNHDSYRAASPWAGGDFGGKIHIFKSGDTRCVELPELQTRVYGCAFTDSIAPAPLRSFHAEKTEGIWNIGLFHGDTRSPDSRYGAITQADIESSGLDYLALGHVHRRSELAKTGETWWAYPGCTEGRGFDECGEKGALYIEVSDAGVTGEFIPLARRRYEIIELDISEGIPAAPPEGRGEDIVRIILTGESDTAPQLAELQRAWEDSFFALQLRDRSRLRRDLWEGSAQDSLRGLFLRKMREKYDSAQTEAEKQKITQALRWGLAALEGREAVSEI